MTEYIIVRAATPAKLEEQVQVKLIDGWELQGGVCSDHVFFQAMKRGDKDHIMEYGINGSEIDIQVDSYHPLPIEQ